jgi:hypothetical protein
MRGYDTGISTVAEPDAVFPDDKSTGLGSIVGSGKRFDIKIPDLEPLIIPANMTVDLFVRSAPVVEEILECPSRGINRNSKAPGEHVEAFDMVAMLMRYQHGIDLSGIEGRPLHSRKRLFRAQSGIQEECPVLPLKKNAVTFTSAGQDRAAHRPIIGRSRIIVFNSSQFFEGTESKGSFTGYPDGHELQ